LDVILNNLYVLAGNIRPKSLFFVDVHQYDSMFKIVGGFSMLLPSEASYVFFQISSVVLLLYRKFILCSTWNNVK